MLRGGIVTIAVAIGAAGQVQQSKTEAAGIRIGFVGNRFGSGLDIGGWTNGFAGNIRLGNGFAPEYRYFGNNYDYYRPYYNYAPYQNYIYRQYYSPAITQPYYNPVVAQPYYNPGLQYQIAAAQASAQAAAEKQQIAQQKQSQINASVASEDRSVPKVTQKKIYEGIFGKYSSNEKKYYQKPENKINPPGFILPANWQHSPRDIQVMLRDVGTKSYIKRYGDGEKVLGKGTTWTKYLSGMLHKLEHN